MTADALAVMAVLYGLGVRRYDAIHPERPFSRLRAVAFLAGIAALGSVLLGPVDRLAGTRFVWHMVQHLAMTMVAAPLLLLGRPTSLARRVAGPGARRVILPVLRGVGRLGHPAFAWWAFAAVLWASHFTILYQAALESAPLHSLEHALYLGASLLFWLPVVDAEPTRHRMGPAARILYVFLAGAASALLASTLVQSGRVLYPAYAGPGALVDQQAAGAVMWIAGGLLFLMAALLVAWGWARSERRSIAEPSAEPGTQSRARPARVTRNTAPAGSRSHTP
jgi:cytochrome c oxidase assembly factor CtaG